MNMPSHLAEKANLARADCGDHYITPLDRTRVFRAANRGRRYRSAIP